MKSENAVTASANWPAWKSAIALSKRVSAGLSTTMLLVVAPVAVVAAGAGAGAALVAVLISTGVTTDGTGFVSAGSAIGGGGGAGGGAVEGPRSTAVTGVAFVPAGGVLWPETGGIAGRLSRKNRIENLNMGRFVSCSGGL